MLYATTLAVICYSSKTLIHNANSIVTLLFAQIHQQRNESSTYMNGCEHLKHTFPQKDFFVINSTDYDFLSLTWKCINIKVFF